jgi:hypothetical protein
MIVQKLLGPFCDAWLGVVSLPNQSSSVSGTVERTDCGKNMIDIILARQICPLGRTLPKWNLSGLHMTVSIIFGQLTVWCEIIAGFSSFGSQICSYWCEK